MCSLKSNIFVTVGLLILLSGCAIGPKYIKPTSNIPAAYKENQDWKVAQPKENITRGAWWKIFSDVQLNNLEDQVTVSNQNIIMAQAQFDQARALVQATRAGFFPIVSGGGSFTRTRTGSSETKAKETSNYLLNGDVSWQLDLWGKVRDNMRASRASAQASAADLETTRLSIQSELVQDYIQLCTYDTELKIFDETMVVYSKFLDITQKRYASGVAAKSDVLQAKTQLDGTRAQAMDIALERVQMEHAIALLVGKSPSDFSIPVSPLPVIVPALPVGLPSDILERRPDIASAERKVASANAQIGVAETAYFPSLTFSASGTSQGLDLSKVFSSPNPLWSVGPSLLETFIDGGLRIAQTRQARAVYEADVANYRQTVLTAFQEVEDNLAALRILEQEAQVQDQAVSDAHQAVTLITNQYKAGTASALDVITSQATELTDRKSAVDILSRRLIACVLLIKALGGGWDMSLL